MTVNLINAIQVVLSIEVNSFSQALWKTAGLGGSLMPSLTETAMNAQPLLVARQFMCEHKFWGNLFIIWATYLECKTLQNRNGKKYNTE